MRASLHLVRPHPAPSEPVRGPGTAVRRWLDPVLAVLCCVLDLSVFLLAGAPSGGLVTDVALPAEGAAGIAGVTALAAVAAPVLAWRRRAPLAVFGGLSLHSLLAVLVCGYRPFFGLAVALHTIATRARWRSALPALAVALLPSGLGLADALSAPPGQRGLVVVGVAGIAVTGAWLAGRWARGKHRQQSRLQLQRQAELQEAAVAERSRIAHDLLDIVTHCLSAMLLQAAGARRVLASDPEQAEKALTTIEASGLQATGELRRLLGVLRASGATRFAGPAGLPGAEATGPGGENTPLSLSELGPFLDQVRAAGVPVRLRTQDEPDREAASLDLSTGTGADHGPAASTVEMRWANGALELVVGTGAADVGQGDFVPAPRATTQETFSRRSLSA